MRVSDIQVALIERVYTMLHTVEMRAWLKVPDEIVERDEYITHVILKLRNNYMGTITDNTIEVIHLTDMMLNRGSTLPYDEFIKLIRDLKDAHDRIESSPKQNTELHELMLWVYTNLKDVAAHYMHMKPFIDRGQYPTWFMNHFIETTDVVQPSNELRFGSQPASTGMMQWWLGGP
jgi:hypothetical protein